MWLDIMIEENILRDVFLTGLLFASLSSDDSESEEDSEDEEEDDSSEEETVFG